MDKVMVAHYICGQLFIRELDSTHPRVSGSVFCVHFPPARANSSHPQYMTRDETSNLSTIINQLNAKNGIVQKENIKLTSPCGQCSRKLQLKFNIFKKLSDKSTISTSQTNIVKIVKNKCHFFHVNNAHKQAMMFVYVRVSIYRLTHRGRATHICISKLTIIGSDNGLSPDRRQAIIWTNAGLLLIGPLGTNFSEILIEILTFSFKKMRMKVSSAKRRPFCLGLNVLTKAMQNRFPQCQSYRPTLV